MELIRCILHIMDTAQNLFAPSDIPMEKLNEEIEPILMSKLKRVFKSQNKRQATFDNSDIEKWIFDYKTSEASFEDTSKRIAQRIFEEKRKYNLFHSSDFIFCEVKVDDVRYLVGIDNANTQKLTHTIHSGGGKVENEFLLHKALFSESLLKDDRAFIIEYAASALQLIETPYHNTYVFEEILQCKAKQSYKETLKIMSESAEVISERYNLNALETMPALKSAVVECIKEEDTLQAEEIAQQVFHGHTLAQQDFVRDMKSQGVDSMSVENIRPAKSEKTEKIKTDSGIELTIPVDLLNSKNDVEFITEDDGKLSIRLKNIHSIRRK